MVQPTLYYATTTWDSHTKEDITPLIKFSSEGQGSCATTTQTEPLSVSQPWSKVNRCFGFSFSGGWLSHSLSLDKVHSRRNPVHFRKEEEEEEEEEVTSKYLVVVTKMNCHSLQKDLDKLADWEIIWRMEFHANKCKVLSISRRKFPIKHDYVSPVKRICVFEHSVMTNFNCACPAIQRG